MEGRPADEAELLARAQRGDQGAFEEIVQRYQQVAFRVAYVITGSAPEAEDAAQEGMFKAYRALHTFRTGAEPRPWLLRIVANEARNRARSAGRARLGPASMGPCGGGRACNRRHAAGLHTDANRDRGLGEPSHQSAPHDGATHTVTAPIRDARVEPRPGKADHAGGGAERGRLAGAGARSAGPARRRLPPDAAWRP